MIPIFPFHLAHFVHKHTLRVKLMDLGIPFQRPLAYRAAFVQRDSRKINPLKDVFKGNSLADTILEEYDLKNEGFSPDGGCQDTATLTRLMPAPFHSGKARVEVTATTHLASRGLL